MTIRMKLARRSAGLVGAVLACVTLCPAVASAAGRERDGAVVELVPSATPPAPRPRGPALVVSARDEMSGAVVISGELGVAESVGIALAHNPQLQSVRRERQRARGAVVEARSGFLPDLRLSGQYFRRVKVPSISFGGVATTIGSPNNWAFGATLTQPLYLGGAVINAYRSARVGQQIAEEQIRQVTQDVIFGTRKSYYDIRLAQEFVAADREQQGLAQAFLNEVEKRLEQGVASNFDVLRARVELANVNASLIKSENALPRAETAFLRVLGVSQDSQVALVDPLVYEPLQPEVREAMRQALLNRPEVLASRLSVKAQEHRVEESKAGLLPKVFLSGNYELAKPGVGGFGSGWDDEFQAVVSVEFPLFEGGRTAGRLAQGRAVLGQFRTAVRDSEEQVLLEVTQAFLSLEDADEFVRSQMANLEQARESSRLADVGYREGVRRQVEVLDARTALTEARKNFSEAVYGHMLSRLSLERSTGALARGSTDRRDLP